MYAALWRVLPGQVWAKVAQMVVFTGMVVALLMGFVFPVIADVFLTEESTVGG
jgi:hypothetical protein